MMVKGWFKAWLIMKLGGYTALEVEREINARIGELKDSHEGWARQHLAARDGLTALGGRDEYSVNYQRDITVIASDVVINTLSGNKVDIAPWCRRVQVNLTQPIDHTPSQEVDDFRKGVKAFFDYLLARAANNYHGDPLIQEACDEENNIVESWAQDALEEISPQDYNQWKTANDMYRLGYQAGSKSKQ